MKNKKKILSIFMMIGLVFMLVTNGLGAVNAAKVVRFKKNKIEVSVGKSVQNPLISVKKGKKVVYRSANKKIAVVNSKGKITGKKAGKTKITATYQKKKYTCSVTVKKVRGNTSTPAATTKTTSTVMPTAGIPTATARVVHTVVPTQTVGTVQTVGPTASMEPVITDTPVPTIVTTPMPVLPPVITPAPSEEPEKTDIGELKVTYIDVGQADSALIQTDRHNILVDCGNDADEDLDAITKVLNENGVQILDTVILTHWHEDHIGCFRYLPNKYEIKSVYIRENVNHVSSKIYEYTKESIEENNIDVHYPKVGDSTNFGNIQLQFVGPVAAEQYDDENANSIAFVLKFGENKFFFGGDTTQEGETDILKQYSDVIVDVDCYKFVAKTHRLVYGMKAAFL